MTDFSGATFTALPSNVVSFGSDNWQALSSRTQFLSERQIMQDALTSTNVNLMSERWPYLMNNPEAFIDLASSVDPITAATQGSIMSAQHSLSLLANGWSEMPEEEQRSQWALLSEQQQQAMIHSGVVPPQSDDNSWLGDVLDFGAKVTGTVLGGVGSAINLIPGGSQALSVLTTIGNAPFAVIRGIRQLDSWQQWVAALGATAAVVGGVVAAPFTLGGSLTTTMAGIGTLGLLATAGGGVAASAVGGTQYFNAVKESWDGERAFLPSAQQEAYDILQQDDLFVIAKDIAYELDPYDLAAEFAGVANATDEQVLLNSISRVALQYAQEGTPEFELVQQNLYKLYQDETFRSAVKTLQNGKISIGRDVARVLQIDPDSDLHRIVSGSVDAVSIFAMDPLLAAAPIVKTARFAKYSEYGSFKALRQSRSGKANTLIATGDNLEWRVTLGQTNKKVRAMDEQIVEAINVNRSSLMPKNMRPIWTEIRDHLSAQGLLDANMLPSQRLITTDDLYDWMRTSNEQSHIARGISTVPGLGFTAIKPISNRGGWGTLRKNLREFRDELIDANSSLLNNKVLSRLEEVAAKQIDEFDLGLPEHTLDTPLHNGLVSVDLSEVGVRETLGATLGRTTGTFLSILPFSTGQKLGTFIDSVSNMAPRTGAIALDGSATVDDITTFVNAFGMTLNIPPYMRQKWIDVLTGQADVAARSIVLQHFYDSVFTASGFKNNFRGKQVYEEFMQKFNQAFGIGGIDELALNTANGQVLTRRGAIPRQSDAIHVAIPNVREMILGQRLDSMLGQKIAVVNPGKMVDMVQNRVWKPSVVLRIGFIPRAIGEEALAWVARGTTGQVLAENRGRKLARMDVRDDIIERVSKGEQLDEIFNSTVRKIESGVAFDDLTLGERRLLSGWRNPNDVKRLQRIVERRTDPSNFFMSTVMEYEKWLRKVLDPDRYVDGWQTSGRKRFVDAVDSDNPLISAILLGKEHSWRRVGLGGLRPELRTATRDWVLKHSDQVMRATSAGNVSYRQDIVNDPAAVVSISDEGQMVAQQRLRDPHARELYTPGSTDYDFALHEHVNYLFDDPIIGPVLEKHVGFMRPARMTDELFNDFGNIIDSWRKLDPDIQQLILDLYFNRQDRLTTYAEIKPAQKYLEQDGSYQLSRIRREETREARKAIDILVSNKLDDELKRWFAYHFYQDSVVSKALKYNQDISQIAPLIDRRINTKTYQKDFSTSIDDFKTRVLNDLESSRLDPTVRAKLDLSVRTIQSDGQSVANRIPANRRRAYVPEVQDFTMLREKIDLELRAGVSDPTQIAYNIAEELMGTNRPRAATDELVLYLEDSGIELLALSIFELLKNNYYKASSGFIRNAGFTDARVAQWIGDVLSGTQMDQVIFGRGVGSEIQTMQYYDIPTAQVTKVGDTWEGVRNANKHQNGTEMFTFDEAVAERLTTIRGQVRADDQLFGITQEEALVNMFNTSIDHVLNTIGRNAQVRYVPVDPSVVAVTQGGKYTPIQPDRIFDPRTSDQVFVLSDDGTLIKADFNDRRFFTPQNVPGGEPMWELVSPVMMDKIDEFAGRARLVRKNITTVDRATGKTGQTTDLVRARWSRASDVPTTGVPDQVIGPKFKQAEANTWDRILTFGFDRVVTPMIDAFLREPMSLHYFVQARLQNARFLQGTLSAQKLKALNDNITIDITGVNNTAIAGYRQDFALKPEYVNTMAVYDKLYDGLWDIAREQNMYPFQYLRTLDEGTRRALSAQIFETPNGMKITNEVIDSLEYLEKWWDNVNVLSSQNAIRNLEPFLDTSESKSMFSQYTKNLLPFWYAEENFIKRWLRTAQQQGLFGVETIRKGQLGYMGLQHAGIIRTDSNGNDWVVIPGSGALQELISTVVPGMDTLPVGVMMQTSTNSLLPGFSAQAGSPSISPFATLPLAFMSQVFPEMQNWERAFAGDIGTDRTLYEKFVPPSARRFVDAFTAGDDNAQFASAMAQAMIMMEAQGKGLPTDYTPEQKQEYLDKLREHARITMLTRAILGFVSPGAPSAMVTGEEIGSFGWATGLGIESPTDLFSDRYNTLIQEFGYEDGLAKFLDENPYADMWDIVNPIALTVSQSETIAGASLPATEPALQWYDSNNKWAEQNPYAAAWLVPNDEDDPFSRYAYSQQTANGLRRKLAPEELLAELKYKEGSIEYFPTKAQFDVRMMEAGNDPIALNAVEQQFKNWKTMFFAANPIFEQRITSNEGTLRRERTLQELRRAISDPLTPQSQSLQAIGQIIRAYDRFVGELSQNKLNGRGADNQKAKRNLIDGFLLWVESWKQQYPEQTTFYDSIISREIEPLIG